MQTSRQHLLHMANAMCGFCTSVPGSCTSGGSIGKC